MGKTGGPIMQFSPERQHLLTSLVRGAPLFTLPALSVHPTRKLVHTLDGLKEFPSLPTTGTYISFYILPWLPVTSLKPVKKYTCSSHLSPSFS